MLPIVRSYSSNQSVPSNLLERVCFWLWAFFLTVMVLVCGTELIRYPERAEIIALYFAFGLLLCVPWGASGLLLRRRRLKKLAEREAFLSAFANLK